MTRKQLESQGIATIKKGEDVCLHEKWALVMNEDYVHQGYVFSDSLTITWGDDKIQNLIDFYEGGIEKL
jgi:hypothetical protein